MVVVAGLVMLVLEVCGRRGSADGAYSVARH